jgi:hypothetical protein
VGGVYILLLGKVYNPRTTGESFMRITVRQLKRLIKEAIEDVASGGLPPLSPRTKARIKTLAKRYYAHVSSSGAGDVLDSIAQGVQRLPGGKSLSGTFAYVEMVMDEISKLPDGDFTYKDMMEEFPNWKEEWQQQLKDDENLYA